MDQTTIPLRNLVETAFLGRSLGEIAEPGDLITLAGSLGAGKTTLTQFIGQGLQVPDSDYITSPTFALVHEYQGRIPLYHMDLYRMSDESEIEELGLSEYIHGEGLTVVEWPDRLGSFMPAERLEIDLVFLTETARLACLKPFGTSWQKRVASLAISQGHGMP